VESIHFGIPVVAKELLIHWGSQEDCGEHRPPHPHGGEETPNPAG